MTNDEMRSELVKLLTDRNPTHESVAASFRAIESAGAPVMQLNPYVKRGRFCWWRLRSHRQSWHSGRNGVLDFASCSECGALCGIRKHEPMEVR